jgi:hypothetical protein|tara:strand:+ start:223 stop:534 length:312 start_codon:yes stop_codon:yes gene_type:complete
VSENNGARSYKGEVIGDSMAITINFKWALQICVLVGALVYGYWQIESRIRDLENKIIVADENIGNLLDKHILEERVEREELAEKVAWYEKNINPLSWGKRKKK